MPMSKKHQKEIGKFFQNATRVDGSAAILCEARVFAPHLSGVWRINPEWRVAVIDQELYKAMAALLVKAKKP